MPAKKKEWQIHNYLENNYYICNLTSKTKQYDY